MKKMKLAVFFAALVSVLTFSSCLDSDGDGGYDGMAFVTVTGDEFIGYRLYADGGGILIPTTASMKAMGDWSKIKRAQVVFKHLDEQLPEPSEDAKYNVEIMGASPLFGGSDMINTAGNTAADSLYKNQDPILDLGSVGVYKGYITFNPQFNYSSTSPYYFNMSYDRDKDVDIENKKLTLTFHYDNGAGDSYNSINAWCSYPFASEFYRRFNTAGVDSVNVVLRSVHEKNLAEPSYVEKTVKMAVKDFVAPQYGY